MYWNLLEFLLVGMMVGKEIPGRGNYVKMVWREESTGFTALQILGTWRGREKTKAQSLSLGAGYGREFIH